MPRLFAMAESIIENIFESVSSNSVAELSFGVGRRNERVGIIPFGLSLKNVLRAKFLL